MGAAPLLWLAAVAAQEPAAAPPQPRQGPAVARLAFTVPGTSLDPIQVKGLVDAVLQRQICETLVEYRYDGAPPWAEVTPLLAAEWHASDDGRLWVFQLRRDARFHDPESPPLWPGGRRPVRAADVVYSWMRQADARLGADGWFAWSGLVAGLDALHERTSLGGQEAEAAWREALAAEGVEGLRALDERVVLVRLMRDEPHFLEVLTLPYAAVVPREAVERAGAAFLNRPVGSGPFQLAEWIPGNRATFRRAPGWRGQRSPFGDGTAPFLDEVRIRIVPEASTRTQLFEAGELEILPVLADAHARLVPAGKVAPALAERGVRLESIPPILLALFSFNMEDPVVGVVPGDEEGNARRLKLRQALALAFPYERWPEHVRGGDWAAPARSFLPPVLPEAAGAPEFPFRRPDLAHEERLAAARGLLAEAGYPAGGLPELVLDLAPAERLSRTIGELVVDSWRRLGVRCRFDLYSWPEFLQRTGEGKAQIFPRNWTMDWPDAAMVLQIFYGGSGDAINRERFHDAEFDRLYDEYRLCREPQRRRELAHGLLRRLYAQVPAFPVDFPGGDLLVQPWVHNLCLNPFDPYPFKFWRLDTTG